MSTCLIKPLQCLLDRTECFLCIRHHCNKKAKENKARNGNIHSCFHQSVIVIPLPTAERDSEGLLWSRMSHTWMKVSIEQLASKFGSNRCQLRSLTARVWERSVCVWTKSPPDRHDSISTCWLLWSQYIKHIEYTYINQQWIKILILRPVSTHRNGTEVLIDWTGIPFSSTNFIFTMTGNFVKGIWRIIKILDR